MNLGRSSIVAICAALLAACSDSPSAPKPAAPAIDRVDMFVRDTREFPGDEVEFELKRSAAGVTLAVFRPARDWRPRTVLDTIGPGAQEPD